MPFTVEDLHDLIRLLEQRSDWRAELRRLLLSADVLELPALVRQLAEEVQELARAQAQTEARLGELVRAQAQTEARLGELVRAQARTEVRVAELAETLASLGRDAAMLTVDVAGLRGESVERRYRERAPAYLGRLARRLRVLDPATLADELDAEVERGVLTEAERTAVLLADLVATGRRVEDQAEVYLLAEVQAGVGPDDVRRAAERAAILARLGRPVIPIVGGAAITAEAATLARERGVWQVLDGQVTPPGQG